LDPSAGDPVLVPSPGTADPGVVAVPTLPTPCPGLGCTPAGALPPPRADANVLVSSELFVPLPPPSHPVYLAGGSPVIRPVASFPDPSLMPPPAPVPVRGFVPEESPLPDWPGVPLLLPEELPGKPRPVPPGPPPPGPWFAPREAPEFSPPGPWPP